MLFRAGGVKKPPLRNAFGGWIIPVLFILYQILLVTIANIADAGLQGLCIYPWGMSIIVV